MQKLWDTTKRPKFLIISTDEREKFQVSYIDQIFNKIIAENSPKPRRQTQIDIRNTKQLGRTRKETHHSISWSKH